MTEMMILLQILVRSDKLTNKMRTELLHIVAKRNCVSLLLKVLLFIEYLTIQKRELTVIGPFGSRLPYLANKCRKPTHLRERFALILGRDIQVVEK